MAVVAHQNCVGSSRIAGFVLNRAAVGRLRRLDGNVMSHPPRQLVLLFGFFLSFLEYADHPVQIPSSMHKFTPINRTDAIRNKNGEPLFLFSKLISEPKSYATNLVNIESTAEPSGPVCHFIAFLISNALMSLFFD